MRKTVTYRRINNKLRTKNRDLSRHKRSQSMDRSFGNNGSVNSLGVSYLDTDGDGYKDQITKKRRAQSLHRGSSYGGSQAMAPTYSLKEADSASPKSKKELDNAKEGVEISRELLQKWHSYKSGTEKPPLGYYANTFYKWSSYHPVRAGFTSNDTTGYIYKPVVTRVDATRMTIVLKFELRTPDGLSRQLTLFHGEEDGQIAGTVFSAGFTDTEQGSGTVLDNEDWENEVSEGSPPYAVGATVTRTLTNVTASSLGRYYFCYATNGSSGDVQYSYPVFAVTHPDFE